MRDLRYALRTLHRSPWYASTVIAVLASGMVLGTVAFAVVDGVLFKTLPFERPSELFVVQGVSSSPPDAAAPPVSFQQIRTWADAAPELIFSAVSAAPDAVVDGPGRESWRAAVDERFFDVVGQRPLIGGFQPEDFAWSFASAAEGAAWQPQIISYRTWRQIYGGDPAVVGRTIVSTEREGRVFGRRIVGVLPRDFVFPIDAGSAQPDILVPLSHASRPVREPRLQAIVRVRAAADARQIAERLRAATRASAPAELAGHEPVAGRGNVVDDVHLIPVVEHLGHDERPAFQVVTVAAGLMLLLSCVNVAGLAAARNLERRRELAVRRALGASVGQITRGLAAEIVLLAFAGTCVAALIARPLLLGTLALLPSTVTLMKVPELDARVFTVMALLSVLPVACVSLWSARIAAGVQPDAALNLLSGSSTAMGRRARFILVSAQVTLGFVLVSAGGLSIASFAAAWRTEAGFERNRMLLIEAFVMKYRGADDAPAQLEAAVTTLASLPGVEEVAVSSIQPLFNRRGTPWSGLAPQGWKGKLERVSGRSVTSNYFNLMRLDLVRGRWPVAGEWASGQPVAILSASAARMFWPDRDPIGQTLLRSGRDPLPIVVIGVVEDARYAALDANPIADVYLPGPIVQGTTGVYLHARASRDVDQDGVLSNATAALSAAGLRLEQAVTHEDAMFAALKHRALPAWLFGWLGIGAVLVLGTGILGLLAVSTAQRTREMGIRVALGAGAAAVVRLLVREQLAAVAAGLAVGSLISAWIAGYVRSQLYGVQPYDPVVWSAITTIIIAVATGAVLAPALRAARVDPVAALRAE